MCNVISYLLLSSSQLKAFVDTKWFIIYKIQTNLNSNQCVSITANLFKIRIIIISSSTYQIEDDKVVEGMLETTVGIACPGGS